jgi:hypothetical protein
VGSSGVRWSRPVMNRLGGPVAWSGGGWTVVLGICLVLE